MFDSFLNLFSSAEDKAERKQLKEEEKKQELLSKIEQLNKKYEEYLNTVCYDGKKIVIYKNFTIYEPTQEIGIAYVHSETASGFVSTRPLWVIENTMGGNFLKNHRINFIKIRDQLEKLGWVMVSEETIN